MTQPCALEERSEARLAPESAVVVAERLARLAELRDEGASLLGRGV